MTNLPQTVVEVEALTFARVWIADRRNLDLFGLGVPTLNPEAGQIFLRRTLKMIAASHPLNMMGVIDHAREGWDDADAVLRELAIEIVDRGEPLPTALGAYVMEMIRGHKTRGPKKATNALQDILVAGLVWELVTRFPQLNPTRNRSSRRVSHCDIAAVAVTEARIGRLLSYKQVETLWGRYGLRLCPSN